MERCGLSIVIRLPKGQPRNHSLILSRGKRFISSPQHSDRFWVRSSLSYSAGTGRSVPGRKKSSSHSVHILCSSIYHRLMYSCPLLRNLCSWHTRHKKHGSNFGSIRSGWTAFITKHIKRLANILSLHCGIISGKWGDVQVSYSLGHANPPWRRDGNLQSPLLGLCHTSITVAATSVVMLLATIMLTSLVVLMSEKTFFSRHVNVTPERWRAGLCMAWLQCAGCCWLEINSAYTKLKWYDRYTNSRQYDHVANVEPESPPAFKSAKPPVQ